VVGLAGAVALAVAVAAGVIVWLLVRGGDSAPEQGNASTVSPDELRKLADAVDHPIFWMGQKEGYTYELTRNNTGSIWVRYLPSGVEPGADKPYLTVATYPFPRALTALKKVARDRGESTIRIARNGIVVPAKAYPQSVHVAYPRVDYQVEVFDPTPGAALQAVTSGELASLGGLRGTATNAPAAVPTAASRAELTALATSLGHPVYWAGPRVGYTYEVTQDSSGKVFIRYLPPGVAAGSSKQFLTVATYPFPAALGAIQALDKSGQGSTIQLSGGGLAHVDPKYPKNIHLAYPDSDYQVEVFAPSAAAARRVVSSDKISAVG